MVGGGAMVSVDIHLTSVVFTVAAVAPSFSYSAKSRGSSSFI